MTVKDKLHNLESLALAMPDFPPSERREAYGKVQAGILDLKNIALREELPVSNIRLVLADLDSACHSLAHPRARNYGGDERHVTEALSALARLRYSTCFGGLLRAEREVKNPLE